MTTIKEVAERAGVSVGTVSNVLSGLPTVSPDLRARVDKAIRDLRYRPSHVARSLKLKQTRTLGVVISDITNPFFPELVRGAEDAAFARNYTLITFNTDDRVEREKQVFEMLSSRRVDGVLLVVALPRGDVSHIEAAIETGTKIVCVDRIPVGLDVDSVTVDNAGGALNCVRHLIEQGHRRIACLNGAEGMYIAQERLRGYKDALKEAGIAFSPALLREGDFRSEPAYRAAKALLQTNPPPTALFVTNFLMTLGVLKAMEELGLETPGDLALATFDRLALAESFRPRLTAVAQPSYQIGHQGATLLIDRVEERQTSPKPVHIVLDTELRIAESTLGRRIRKSA